MLRTWRDPATRDVFWEVPTGGEGTGGVNYGEGARHVRCRVVGKVQKGAERKKRKGYMKEKIDAKTASAAISVLSYPHP